jgi:hypothetical protein
LITRGSAQPAAELAGAGVDGVDAGRAGVEQRLGEAAGCRAQVERDGAGRVDPEDGQGVGQLDRPAQRAGVAYLDGGVGSYAGSRALRRHAVDQDRAFLNQPGGIVEAGEAALEQGEQGDEGGAPGGGHGRVLLGLGLAEQGPSGQGGPRAGPCGFPPCPRTPKWPLPMAAAR